MSVTTCRFFNTLPFNLSYQGTEDKVLDYDEAMYKSHDFGKIADRLFREDPPTITKINRVVVDARRIDEWTEYNADRLQYEVSFVVPVRFDQVNRAMVVKEVACTYMSVGLNWNGMCRYKSIDELVKVVSNIKFTQGMVSGKLIEMACIDAEDYVKESSLERLLGFLDIQDVNKHIVCDFDTYRVVK